MSGHYIWREGLSCLLAMECVERGVVDELTGPVLSGRRHRWVCHGQHMTGMQKQVEFADAVEGDTSNFKTVVILNRTRESPLPLTSRLRENIQIEKSPALKLPALKDLLQPNPTRSETRDMSDSERPADEPKRKLPRTKKEDDPMKNKLLAMGISEDAIDYERNVIEYFFRFTIHTTTMLTRKCANKRAISTEMKKQLRFLWSLWITGKISKQIVMREVAKHFKHCSIETRHTNLIALFTRWHFNSWHSRTLPKPSPTFE